LINYNDLNQADSILNRWIKENSYTLKVLIIKEKLED